MRRIASGARQIGFDQGGRLAWLSGPDGANRVAAVDGPLIRLVLRQGGERVELLPDGEPVTELSPGQIDLSWSRFARSDGQMRCSITARASIQACETAGGGGFAFHLQLQAGEADLVEVLYPIIGGLTGEALLFPHHAGERVVDPARTLCSERYSAFHRGGSIAEGNGRFSREITYCGLASMAWLELDDATGGTYLGSHDPSFGLTGLRVESDGSRLTLALRRWSECRQGFWEAPVAVLAPHEGDWHTGARIYRSWIQPLLPDPQRPEAMAGRVAVNPRYDFKNGGKVHHRFAEIPAMHDAGAAAGIDHFFIAGWNRGGFDSQYPEYYPDLELGTVGDLARGCQYITAQGGAVTFYINARLFDLRSDYYPALGEEWAIRDERGAVHSEEYAPNRFAVMCPAHAPWQQHLIDTARWLIRTTGCQGIYLDQLGSATPFPCYAPDHRHPHPGLFNQGYIEVLERLRPETALMIENCGDIYSSRIWASYVWNGELYDEFYELYRYTFPDHQLICRVQPRPMEDLRLRERLFYQDLQRAWLLGAHLWASPQRRFTVGDETMKAFLLEAVRLRQAAEPWLANARFVDTEGIQLHGRGGARATCFAGDHFTLVAVANPQGTPGEIRLAEPVGRVTLLEMGKSEPQDWASTRTGIPLPTAHLSLLILHHTL